MEGAGPTVIGYKVDGSSDDWVYENAHAIFTATGFVCSLRCFAVLRVVWRVRTALLCLSDFDGCFAVELRDKGPPPLGPPGGFGFLLPPDQIRKPSFCHVLPSLCCCVSVSLSAGPVGQEIWAAVQLHMTAAQTGVVSFRSVASSVTAAKTHTPPVSHSPSPAADHSHSHSHEDRLAMEHKHGKNKGADARHKH